MALEKQLERMEAALEDGDIATARELLGKVRAEFSARNAWHWLRTNQPESYEQLIEKLEQARTHLSNTGLVELRQLTAVVKWCEEHGVELADLNAPDHIHKYREAVSYLDLIRKSDTPDDVKVEEMRDAIRVIQGHSTRRDTRAWKVNRRAARMRQERDTQD